MLFFFIHVIGSYFATFHGQGIALWGSSSWVKIIRFQHNNVELIDFSPCERYLVTYARTNETAESPQSVKIWDIRWVRSPFQLSDVLTCLEPDRCFAPSTLPLLPRKRLVIMQMIEWIHMILSFNISMMVWTAARDLLPCFVLTSQQPAWPHFQWSFNGDYLARIGMRFDSFSGNLI